MIHYKTDPFYQKPDQYEKNDRGNEGIGGKGNTFIEGNAADYIIILIFHDAAVN